MASYKAGFDPPTRPGDLAPRSRKLAYGQPPSSKQEHREADIAHISGQMESRRGVTPVNRMAPSGLPRPDPSSIRTRSQTRTGETTGFGFRRTTSETTSGPPRPELKTKTSRNVLRRKPTLISRGSDSSQAKDESIGASSPPKWSGSGSSSERRPSIERSLNSAEAYTDIFTRPARMKTPALNEPTVYPELDRYRNIPTQTSGPNTRVTADLPHKLATQDLPPPTPLSTGTPLYSGGPYSHHRYSGYSGSGYSASPSTRFSESPGPGPYSRDTTPTSMSSQSSGIIALKTTTPRLRQGSPALNRPPVTRRRAGSISNEVDGKVLDPQGLPSLRESITSSSSNSTVRGDAKSTPKSKKKKKRLSPLPPSPPPRKSSQKSNKKTSVDQQDSPSKPSLAPAKPVMMSPEPDPSKSRSEVMTSPGPKIPPSRPSRDGAPDLHTQLGEAMPVIQSNLVGVNFSERRKSNLPLPRSGITSPVPTQLGSKPQQSSRLPSRQPSPSPYGSSTTASGLGIVPNLRPQPITIPSRSMTSRTPSPSVANTKSRFALFGRRTKTAPDPPGEKVLRKGPAAGTGHEGYGRYALRGRSTSAGGLVRARDRSMSGASSSQESVASTRAHDPFLLERMSPVVIAGGGEIVENRNASSDLARTDSNMSLFDRPSMDSKGSLKPGLNNETPRATLWPSAMPKDDKQSSVAIQYGRRPSDSSEEIIGKRSLAFRRSMQRLNNSTSALNMPKPLNIVSATVASPSIGSIDTGVFSEDSQPELKSNLSGSRKLQPPKPKKLEKRPKSPRKWNFFHRDKSVSKTQPEDAPAVQVSVGKPAAKAIPHYAMIDSSDENTEPLDSVNFEDILRDVEVTDLTNEDLDAIQFGAYKEEVKQAEDLQKTALSPPPQHTPEPEPEPQPAPLLFSSPELIEAQPMPPPPAPPTDLHLTEEIAPVRPSRLPQVGRIPKVINSRPGATSPKSFSRPFARLSVSHAPQIPLVIDTASVALGPSPPKPSTPEPVAEPELPEPEQSTSERQVSGDSKSSTTNSQQDFLAFSPRKNSEATTSSSGGLSFVGTTAVIPEAGAELEEDEVWDEYNDLIENDDTMRVPASATSSHGHPFQYESYESRRIRKSKLQPKESPTFKHPPTINEPPAEEVPQTRRSLLTASSVYSADMSATRKESFIGVPTPTTPMSFTDFFSGYGDRNNSMHGDSAKKPERASKGSSHNSVVSTKSLSHQRISEQENQSPISQVNLRIGSMTVSKWLTFGHVLFSPARDEIMQLEGPTKRHSILVIDGLGNDDWSFYAAETYPTSTFYNLSPSPPPTSSSSRTSFPPSPPNYRQIQYSSPLTKFPFPSSTFHVVVFRFPAAMSEPAYKNIISEAKRVLQPGGYLECAVLDLDMMNMGNRGRRAVRGLKMKMQAADPTVNIGSTSDTILRLIGKRGFTDVKSCKVGVPVASTIPSTEKEDGKKEEMSLADMMKDESAAGDEGITKMVAKVGRWWYSRCYESALGERERSIFRDKALLSECEEWNASFKLLVAYAMKPEVGRRRTASV